MAIAVGESGVGDKDAVYFPGDSVASADGAVAEVNDVSAAGGLESAAAIDAAKAMTDTARMTGFVFMLISYNGIFAFTLFERYKGHQVTPIFL
jgi:hypothetical protein